VSCWSCVPPLSVSFHLTVLVVLVVFVWAVVLHNADCREVFERHPRDVWCSCAARADPDVLTTSPAESTGTALLPHAMTTGGVFDCILGRIK
jgi:hypothetical protein